MTADAATYSLITKFTYGRPFHYYDYEGNYIGYNLIYEYIYTRTHLYKNTFIYKNRRRNTRKPRFSPKCSWRFNSTNVGDDIIAGDDWDDDVGVFKQLFRDITKTIQTIDREILKIKNPKTDGGVRGNNDSNDSNPKNINKSKLVASVRLN